MRICSSSQKESPMDAKRSLKSLRLRLGGWRNSGNTSRNVNKLSISFWNSPGTRWMSMRWKTKSRKWDKVSIPSRLLIENVILLPESLKKSRDGQCSSHLSVTWSTNPWLQQIKGIGTKSEPQLIDNLKLIRVCLLIFSGSWDFSLTRNKLKSSLKLLRMRPRWRRKSQLLDNFGRK